MAKGSELAQGLPSTIGAAREDAILKLFDEGCAVDWPWIPITSEHEGHHVTIFVRSDYLAFGDPDDFFYMPVAYDTARLIAHRMGGHLPTPKMVDLIADQSEVKLEPRPRTERGALMVSTRIALAHNGTIATQRKQAGAQFGALISGHYKDLVMTAQLLEQPGDKGPVIFGWRLFSGLNIQGVTLFHRKETWYADYSHGLRVVRSDCLVDGVERKLIDALADPEIAPVISYSDESRVFPSSALNSRVFELAGLPSQDERPTRPVPATSTGAPLVPRILRKGVTKGADVGGWQTILNRDPKPDRWVNVAGRIRTWPLEWSWPLKVDDDFGERTEAATESWQQRRGLVANGVVESETRAAVGQPPKPETVPPNEPPVVVPGFEIDAFMQAKWFYPGRRHPLTSAPSGIDLLVMHSTETGSAKGKARIVARDFQNRPAESKASAHYINDVAETIQCVRDEHTSFAGPGTNHNGIQIEQCGYAFRTDWRSGAGALVVARTVKLSAMLVAKHSLPILFCGYEELLTGVARGITLHEEITKACVIAQRERMTDSVFFDRKENRPKTNHQDPHWDRAMVDDVLKRIDNLVHDPI